MAKRISQSLLWLIAAAALAERVVIEDFAGPVDAFFLDDGTAAGLPSSGNSALEKVEDGLRLNYDVARNGPFGAALLGKIWNNYSDLSNASSIRLTYRVEAASSLPGHAALGVVLLDGRACGLAPHCSLGVGFALTDYLASGNVVLDDVDDAGGWRTLEIDLCGEANPYAPFFGLDREGRSLDPATIQGWRLGIVVDSLAGMGNAATGSIVFGELAAVGAGPAPSPPCAPPPRAGARELVGVRVDKASASRVFELGLRHCAEHCANDGECAYFATDPRRNAAVGAYPSCYLFAELHEDDVSFAAPGAPDGVQTWWYEDVREDLCDACACDAATRRADCTRADLATAPRDSAGFDPLEIDLSGNERLVVLGPGALADFTSLERVTLPHALTYLAEDALPDGVLAASLEPGVRRGRNFVDGGPTAQFHDVCCSPGLTVGETLSFCDRGADAPGADAIYDPYVKYLSDDIYAILTAASPLLAEAAASVELCAYYCGLIEDCAAFAYDQLPVGTGATRTSDARVCTMFATVPRASERIGANATNGQPGWVSGLPARSRDAEVIVEPSIMLLDAANDYQTTYTIRLSAPPTRGSVWVTPHAVGEERTEQEAGEAFCEQSGFSQLECESHDHGSCYCEWDEGECWWQEGACGATDHGRHGRRLMDGDVLAFYPPSASLSAARMEVNVTVRLVKDHGGDGDHADGHDEEEGHHGNDHEEEGHHAEAYHHDVHDEDGDHGGYGPGHAAPVPAGMTATILVHHEIESCDAAFQLSARDHSADFRVTVRRPQHDGHDDHNNHRYHEHMRDMRLAVGFIAGFIGIALLVLGCWMIRKYTQRQRELELGRALLVREQVLEARDRVAGFTAPFSVLPCVEIKILRRVRRVTPSTRRLLDGVAMPVPHRSTEPARPRHRREVTS